MLPFVPLLVAAQGAVLVKDGVATAVIDLPANASPSLRYGADQLGETLQAMSRGTLPVGGTAPVKVVLRADPKLGPEEFDLKCDGKTVSIRGGALRGAMYGCFALLEEVLGCHWFNRRVAEIPHRATVVVPVIHLHEKPAFEYREVSFWEAFDGPWAAHNRMNGASMQLTKEMGGRVVYGRFVHTAAELVPPDKYFAEHPEYYALRNGKRTPDQLELTSPEVLRIAKATVERWIEENPDATIFSVSQNDNWEESESPETKAINAEEGASSGLFLRFVNAIAADVARNHPKVLIDTLAYQWTEKPPKLSRPLPNVRVRIAPIDSDFAHGLADSPKNAKPYANLKEWHRITSQLYIWEYCTDFANYLQPLPDLDEIPADIKLFSQSGVVGVFYEGDYAGGGGGEMAELKSYLIGKLLWNPDQSGRAIVEGYCRGVYGAGAPFILQWLDLEHAAARKGATATIYDPPTIGYLSGAVLNEGAKLFDQAEAATAGTPAAGEVARARLALEYVQLARMKPGTEEFTTLAAKVAAKIRAYGITQTSEGGASSEYLKRIGQG
ncbi:MAG TPA: DUF4838 domain-containing protein [Fimbriimonadaceae bacterium]|nr:DUF4838 domain-containing protein [Fimbriimonadaceae bacterium]